ncbi:GNAT family N-acetyltransferase [Streptomyces guryensis]|uniref:GNAT family N-acetyltransferase n=1 Tax=Streptomyces guryensis TaxID=2886947 RepID=A0A9Q3VWI5_9ACTN|nr:GNAT family N-acetyltransferase [Streptomyces guryensis]MCD9878708.1 GNAT family N-acetyltransferase [Streptomyces guryensis]
MRTSQPYPPQGGPSGLVRPRTDRDLAACVEGLAAVHRHSGYPVNWPDHPADWLTPRALLAAWVAELDGRVVGHLSLSRAAEGDGAPGVWAARTGVGVDVTAVVGRLFVSPDARGHGLGAALLARAVEEARTLALHPVLDVVDSDTAATALYERLGWELLDVVEQHWAPDQTVSVRCYAAPGQA